MASGWYDVFCNQTAEDFIAAQNASKKAKEEGRRGNDFVSSLSSADCFFFLRLR